MGTWKNFFIWQKKGTENTFLLRPSVPQKCYSAFDTLTKKAFIFILSVSLSNFHFQWFFISPAIFFGCVLCYFLLGLSFVSFLLFLSRNRPIHCHLEMTKFCVLFFWCVCRALRSPTQQSYFKIFALACNDIAQEKPSKWN